ncbi:hypothetical protein [Devosia rhizoryzae]|uniref:Uncharacterized protein n=1 Tax=Devosia rhizoryzae TaxID=2774137 RepID=A0ABX7C6Q0_9HYPH|nr:hypothetical protein [Devosia rhizoryzae]QQR39463.1 hypothetical protein JI748_00095 [Devosia rhizoryzae]
MVSLPVYSTLFSCLHDEPDFVGSLGRGTHYSVLRSVEWLDVIREPLLTPQIHDFAVIWDEDHDTRVISAIERIYMAGLLSPVQFVGERKGLLSVILASRFFFHGDGGALEQYRKAVSEIASNLGFDSWTSEIGTFDRQLGSPHQTDPVGIINDTDEKVETYLRNIDNLWGLGTRNFEPERDTLYPGLFQLEPPSFTKPLPFPASRS